METTQDSGASSAESGAQGSELVDETGQTETQEVDEGTKRALDDLHKFKKRYKDAEKEKQRLQQQIEEFQTQKLREQEDWKTLAEREAQAKKEALERYESLRESIYQNEKFNAVRSYAMQKGLIPEAERDLSLLSMDGVTVEATSEGRLIVHGAESFVDNTLLKDRSHWFRSKEVPRFNSGGAGQKGGVTPEISASIVVELERKFRRTGSAEDKKAWTEALDAYRKARSEGRA